MSTGPLDAALARLRRKARRTLKNARDRRFDRRYGIEAARPVHLDQLTVLGSNTDFGTEEVIYGAASVGSLRRSFAALPADLSGYTFVDYGSGKGRVLVFAAEYAFEAVVGIEFALELHEIAARNIERALPKLRCPSVESWHVDATQAAIPSGPCVFFFNNPFERYVTERVVDLIAASYRAAPRPGFVITHSRFDHDLLDAECFAPIASHPYVRGEGYDSEWTVYEITIGMR